MRAQLARVTAPKALGASRKAPTSARARCAAITRAQSGIYGARDARGRERGGWREDARGGGFEGAMGPIARETDDGMAVRERVAEVTVADTKRKFLEAYPYPIPSVWATVVQELLVQGTSKVQQKSEYNELASLGFVSVYDQLFEGFPSEEEKGKIFNAFLGALDEDAVRTGRMQRRSSVRDLANGVEGLKENAIFAKLAAKSAEGTLLYTKYIAIGMFRMLELAKATDPAALEALVTAGGLSMSKVSGDLSMYKGLLSKLAAAKELQEEFLEREKRKTAERLAKKAEAEQKAEAEA